MKWGQKRLLHFERSPAPNGFFSSFICFNAHSNMGVYTFNPDFEITPSDGAQSPIEKQFNFCKKLIFSAKNRVDFKTFRNSFSCIYCSLRYRFCKSLNICLISYLLRQPQFHTITTYILTDIIFNDFFWLRGPENGYFR